MPKLLSQEEVNRIAAKLTEAYGLPPAAILEESTYGPSFNWGVKVVIYRAIKVKEEPKWFKRNSLKTVLIEVRSFAANDYEDALTKLEYELSKLNGRTNIAEHYREKFAHEEADEVLDGALRD